MSSEASPAAGLRMRHAWSATRISESPAHAGACREGCRAALIAWLVAAQLDELAGAHVDLDPGVAVADRAHEQEGHLRRPPQAQPSREPRPAHDLIHAGCLPLHA
jgi:hypothetical protein